MIALTLFLHHKETFGDTYKVKARVDRDGDFILEFSQEHKDCYRGEDANVYLNPAQALSLRDQLTALLAAPAEVSTEDLRVAEPVR